MTQFRRRDLREEIFITLAALIEEGIPHINEFLNKDKKYSRTKRGGVVEEAIIQPKVSRWGTVVPIEKPTIRIKFSQKDIGWLSVRSTSDTYKFEIFCLTKNLNVPETDEFISIFAAAVQDWIVGDIRRLQSEIVNAKGQRVHRWYDSYADNVTLGFEDKGALRVARINWWCKCWNFYHVTQGATP